MPDMSKRIVSLRIELTLSCAGVGSPPYSQRQAPLFLDHAAQRQQINDT